AAMQGIGVNAQRVPGCVGIWVGPEKLGAIGVRIRRGVSLHGIALNVETDLRYFDLIVPCGLEGKRMTSLRRLLGDRTPPMEMVKRVLAEQFLHQFALKPA